MRLRFLVAGPADCSAASDLTGYLGSFDTELLHLNCEDGEGFAERLREAQPCDAVIVASPSFSGLREVVETVRDALGDVPVIVNGAGEDSGADLIYTGPCEGLSFAFRTFGFRLKKRSLKGGALTGSALDNKRSLEKHYRAAAQTEDYGGGKG